MSTILKALRRVEEDDPGQPQRGSMRGDIVAGGGKPPALDQYVDLSYYQRALTALGAR